MMNKNFEPKLFEQGIYERWCKKGYFPMCNCPVMLGGGITMVKGVLLLFVSGVK